MLSKVLCSLGSTGVRRSRRFPTKSVTFTKLSCSPLASTPATANATLEKLIPDSSQIETKGPDLQSDSPNLPTGSRAPESGASPSQNIQTKNILSEEDTDMPLKAKMNDLSFSSRESRPPSGRKQDYRASNPGEPSEVIKELPDDEKEDVLFNTIFGVRTIELNRPGKHNSLNSSMIRKIVPRLREWTKSDMANVIIIKGAGPTAFCAGGDVQELADQNKLGEKGQKRSAKYFALEYKLDHLIATYKKPFIAFMDGYTMGGGAGLSIHAPIRIATERTVFAMPETNIGFFPDIGASFFLPRLNGAIGTYLALTSERLHGPNVFYTGVATHFIHSTMLYSLSSRLAELQFKDYDSLNERLDLINSTIEEFSTGLPHDQPMLIALERRKAIDRCFSKNSVPEIISALKAETDQNQEWAQETIKKLYQLSPTSVYVTFRLMKLGKNWTIAEAFKREHQMATRFMYKSDFVEGVDALLGRKDKNPKWDPPSLDQIESESKLVEPYFEVEGIEPITLLNDEDFRQYPFHYGLPSDEMVKDLIMEKRLTPSQVISHFISITGGKQGVKEAIIEILTRKTMRSADGESLVWDETI
ncbi:hypothetical protein K3495_g3738 [Podosphaera aphanis]|nr:hypothetical protein K3495_g3738 [Podosphaera aphanis]